MTFFPLVVHGLLLDDGVARVRVPGLAVTCGFHSAPACATRHEPVESEQRSDKENNRTDEQKSTHGAPLPEPGRHSGATPRA
jgi:hypothetical protein